MPDADPPPVECECPLCRAQLELALSALRNRAEGETPADLE